ncbi:MAG: cyclic pyranopterin monophosphate synthase MoaC [Firmicutes bacterium]|jgi:cyclic pyranopterin phosphate synthase|nr:cyclic pyranopterin monophosphate synthase MoaC [Bacillota bacterium]
MKPEKPSEGLTHLDESGNARMVDVSSKPETARLAVARCRVSMSGSTLSMIKSGAGPKGEVFGTARIAAIMACKKTPDLIPMCHSIPVTGIDVAFKTDEESGIVEIQVTVKTVGKTGAEMEALSGAAVAALTIYDMCKAVDKSMTISDLRLVRKSGGKSGEFVREGEDSGKWDM